MSSQQKPLCLSAECSTALVAVKPMQTKYVIKWPAFCTSTFRHGHSSKIFRPLHNAHIRGTDCSEQACWKACDQGHTQPSCLLQLLTALQHAPHSHFHMPLPYEIPSLMEYSGKRRHATQAWKKLCPHPSKNNQSINAGLVQ